MLFLLRNRAYRKAIADRLSDRVADAAVPPGGACQQHYCHALFASMGRLAKLDGTVTPAEIRYASEVMQKLALNFSQRQEAIASFEQGKQGYTNVLPMVSLMLRQVGRRSELAELFLRYQCGLVFLEGDMNLEQKLLLRDISSELGFTTADFLSVCALMSHNVRRTPRSRTLLQQAYQVLGLQPDAAEAEIRKAYLRLMSRYHPDKLRREDLSVDALRQAQEKSMAIRDAYEVLCGFRKQRV